MAGNPLMDAYTGGQSTPSATASGGGNPLMDAYTNNSATNTKASSFLGPSSDPINQALTGAGKVAGGFLNILGRPFQAVAGAMYGGKTAASNNSGAARLVDPNVLQSIGSNALRGLEGKQNLTFTQAVLGNKDITSQQAYGSATSAKGLLGRAADLAGSIATDPTTLIGAGPSKELAGKGAQALGETAAKQAISSKVVELAGRADMEPIEKAAAVHAAGETARESALQALQKDGYKAAVAKVGGEDALKAELKGTVGSDKAANNILKSTQFHSSDVLQRAIQDIGLNKPEEIAKAGIKGAGEKLANTKAGDVGRFAQRLTQYGATEKQALGKEAGTAQLEARRAAQTEQVGRTQAGQAQFNAIMKDVKPGSPQDEAIRVGLEGSPAEKARFENEHPELVPMRDTLRDTISKNTELQSKAGILPESKTFDPNRYVPRSLTPEMSDAMKRPVFQSWLQRQPNEIKQILSQGGATKARTLYPELSVAQANQKLEPALKEAGVLKDGEHFFNQGALGDIMGRMNKANEAVTQSNYVKALSGIKTGDGKALIAGDIQHAPAGAKQIDMGPLGTVFAHPSLEKELLGVKNIITNDADLSKLKQLYGKWVQTYKIGALTGPGAVTKKVMGDIFQNYRAGVHNPAMMSKATSIEMKISKALRDPANREALQNGKYEQVLQDALGKEDAAMFRAARASGATSAGFGQTDLGAAKAIEGKAGLAKAVAVSPIKASRTMFQKSDETMRLWHFMEKYAANGGDAKSAAASVRKYLYNFNELTPAEQLAHKTVMPFYTFMRKNLPSQIEGLITQPGKYTAAAHVGNALGITGVPSGAAPYQQNDMSAPAGVAKLLGLDPTKAIFTPNLPVNAAENTISQLAAPIGVIPGVKNIVPSSDRAQSAADAARKSWGLLGGPVVDFANAMNTIMSGKSTFSGANIPPGNVEKAKVLLEGLTPATGRVTSAQNLKTRAAILKLLTGVKVSEIKTP